MLPAAGDPYFKLKAAGYVDAEKRLGYDVKIYDAGGYGNLQKQVTQIEDVIQRKVSGIVLVPASSDGTVPVVEKAVASGIPVINDGIATRSDKVTGFVGEPSYVMTEMLAAYAADHLGGKGEVVMLSGPSGLDLTKFQWLQRVHSEISGHEGGRGEVLLHRVVGGAHDDAGFSPGSPRR